jgi:DNA-binding NarL/FixJ family response regulator
MLVKGGNIEVAGVHRAGPFRTEDLLKEEADILLLISRGSMNKDLSAIRKVRASAPNVQILLIGVTGEEAEFLQCSACLPLGAFLLRIKRKNTSLLLIVKRRARERIYASWGISRRPRHAHRTEFKESLSA